MKLALLISKLILSALLAFGGLANGQPYPSKSVRLIVPFPPGGATDIHPGKRKDAIAAAFASALRRRLGVQEHNQGRRI